MDEKTKQSFEFARDTTKQLLTLATGIIALMITFAKDFVQSVDETARLFALLSWGLYLLSVIGGLWTLLALTGTLEAKDDSVPVSIRGSNVTLPATIQILSFLVGLGLTVFTEIAGWGPSPGAGDSGLKSGAYESAVVRVDIRGTVTVYTSSSPHGQGHETAWSQLAAAEFGLMPDDITVIHGDTALCPPTIGTFASRSAAVGGTAIVLAARKVKAKALRIAAHKLDVPEDELEYRAGRVQVQGQPQRALTLAQLAEIAYYAHALPPGEEPGLEAGVYFDPANFTYPFGAHLCLAEVDRETGKVRIRQYVCVDDAGHVINPLLVEGQIHGGMAQGVAQALYEEILYDGNGQLLTNTFGEYAMPTAVEVPDIVTDRTVTPTYVNPLGIKGIGEAATLAATPAVVNAVADALAPLGVRIREMPLKPEKVWRLLNAPRA